MSTKKPQVRLISHTVGSNGETLKDLVVYCARVSNPQSQQEGLSVDRLWNYLKRENHWSPFEMVHVCLEINTNRAISRQLLRHRSFSFQEFSQRYADPTEALGFTFQEARLQDHKNRQNSLETTSDSLKRKWVAAQSHVKDVALGSYLRSLSLGIAKEQARALLPEGLTNSRLYMAGSLRSWLHFIEARTHQSAQKEVRYIAHKCDKIIRELIEEQQQ